MKIFALKVGKFKNILSSSESVKNRNNVIVLVITNCEFKMFWEKLTYANYTLSGRIIYKQNER